MEFKEKHSIYLQIASLFFDKILLKEWRADDRVPSIRELAISLEVNPNTIVRTYTYLQEKGIIYNKRGIGYFVTIEGYNIACSLKKEAFINEEMPGLFNTMDLLNMSIDDIGKLYEEYRSKKSQISS
jgi:GntR family transcriptional regulator